MRHKNDDSATPGGPSVRIPEAIQTHATTIRELSTADAAAVAQAASSIGYVWGDLLDVPRSEAAASELLAHWGSLRTSGRGNLVGLFARNDRLLLAVAVLRDQFSAQLSGWGTTAKPDRKLDVEGFAALVSFLHSSAGMLRLWVDAPPHDRYTGLLIHGAGLSREGTITREDGSVRERYSSV